MTSITINFKRLLKGWFRRRAEKLGLSISIESGTLYVVMTAYIVIVLNIIFWLSESFSAKAFSTVVNVIAFSAIFSLIPTSWVYSIVNKMYMDGLYLKSEELRKSAITYGLLLSLLITLIMYIITIAMVSHNLVDLPFDIYLQAIFLSLLVLHSIFWVLSSPFWAIKMYVKLAAYTFVAYTFIALLSLTIGRINHVYMILSYLAGILVLDLILTYTLFENFSLRARLGPFIYYLRKHKLLGLSTTLYTSILFLDKMLVWLSDYGILTVKGKYTTISFLSMIPLFLALMIHYRYWYKIEDLTSNIEKGKYSEMQERVKKIFREYINSIKILLIMLLIFSLSLTIDITLGILMIGFSLFGVVVLNSSILSIIEYKKPLLCYSMVAFPEVFAFLFNPSYIPLSFLFSSLCSSIISSLLTLDLFDNLLMKLFFKWFKDGLELMEHRTEKTEKKGTIEITRVIHESYEER